MSKRKIPEYHLKRVEEITGFVRNYRINERLSQTEFSNISETHVNTIQRFEVGDKNITLVKIGRAHV